MKIVLQFDDGTKVATKAENLVISQTAAGETPVVVIGYRTAGSVVPTLTFPGHYFSVETLKQRDAKQEK
jgi:hypothetical protein